MARYVRYLFFTPSPGSNNLEQIQYWLSLLKIVAIFVSYHTRLAVNLSNFNAGFHSGGNCRQLRRQH